MGKLYVPKYMHGPHIPKPKSLKDPKSIDFNLINKPLEETYYNIESKLKKEDNRLNNFYFILHGLLTTAFQTYKAIRKLVKNSTEPKYPTQAHILGRSLVDTLFTVVLLNERPEEYARKYEIAGYREAWEDYDRELKRYENDSEAKAHLEETKKFLDSFAGDLGLTEEEKMDPIKYVEFWPIPSKMLRDNKFSDKNTGFLKTVYEDRYGPISEWSHQKWTGMAMGIYATMPEEHWYPGKYESDAVYAGILFLLMILSEIEGHCRYLEAQKLRYIWTLVGTCFQEAKDYYTSRYQVLLK